MNRLLNRENHITFADDPVLKAKVLLKIISLYKGVRVKANIKQKLNLNRIL
jgi:hypothetical protein